MAFKASHVTPLHCAIVKWQVEAVAHLLEAGANPALTDKNGATPLVYAMQQSHSEIARMLLNAGNKSYLTIHFFYKHALFFRLSLG